MMEFNIKLIPVDKTKKLFKNFTPEKFDHVSDGKRIHLKDRLVSSNNKYDLICRDIQNDIVILELMTNDPNVYVDPNELLTTFFAII